MSFGGPITNTVDARLGLPGGALGPPTMDGAMGTREAFEDELPISETWPS